MFHPNICQEIIKYLDYPDQENLSLVNKYYHQFVTNQEGYQTYQAVKRAINENGVEGAIGLAVSIDNNEKKLIDYLVSRSGGKLSKRKFEYLIEFLVYHNKVKLAEYYGKLLGLDVLNSNIIKERPTKLSEEDHLEVYILELMVRGSIAGKNEYWKEYYDKFEKLIGRIFKDDEKHVILSLSACQTSFLAIAMLSFNEASYHYISERVSIKIEREVFPLLYNYFYPLKGANNYFLKHIKANHSYEINMMIYGRDPDYIIRSKSTLDFY